MAADQLHQFEPSRHGSFQPVRAGWPVWLLAQLVDQPLKDQLNHPDPSSTSLVNHHNQLRPAAGRRGTDGPQAATACYSLSFVALLVLLSVDISQTFTKVFVSHNTTPGRRGVTGWETNKHLHLTQGGGKQKWAPWNIEPHNQPLILSEWQTNERTWPKPEINPQPSWLSAAQRIRGL